LAISFHIPIILDRGLEVIVAFLTALGIPFFSALSVEKKHIAKKEVALWLHSTVT